MPERCTSPACFYPQSLAVSRPPSLLPSISFVCEFTPVCFLHPPQSLCSLTTPSLCSPPPPHPHPPMLADWYLLINVTKASLLLTDLIREIGCPFLSIFYYLRLSEPPEGYHIPPVLLGTWAATDTQLNPCVLSCPRAPKEAQSPEFPLVGGNTPL